MLQYLIFLIDSSTDVTYDKYLEIQSITNQLTEDEKTRVFMSTAEGVMTKSAATSRYVMVYMYMYMYIICIQFGCIVFNASSYMHHNLEEQEEQKISEVQEEEEEEVNDILQSQISKHSAYQQRIADWEEKQQKESNDEYPFSNTSKPFGTSWPWRFVSEM